MDANRKRVLELAAQGDWDEVLRLVARNPVLARAQDDFGMLALHWACTEPSVRLGVVSALTRAFPGGCELENLSGMLPLHVAIKARAPSLLVSALLDVCPQAALAKDGSGRYPVDLAVANSLPISTIELIRKAGARALQSASKLRSASSMDDLTSVSSSDHDNQSEDDEDIPMLMKTQSTVTSTRSLGRKLSSVSSTVDPNTISLQLKELLSQLHQLSVDIRVNSTSSPSSTTYRSSFSSAFSASGLHGAEGITAVLWNPSDRFGIVLEPAVKEMGARIKGFSSRSDVLGVESLAVGDVLVNINGASVANTAFASVMRFLKHSKGTCKLRFRSAVDVTAASKCSSGSNPAAEQDNAMYSKVADMLEATLKKVSAVEETVRLSSAMPLCT
ncbi:hypothetical protein PHYPSEUDO_003537 [Phytophthora pseudosyringae]|uniref:PDZ domain-containing protein n=1 Tax=Phytophthora pseudosyringae TaxID=221518 RepID=A0A8T1VR46_9STRA|nr:hypothetical protein PHYPSEUDO_003537 [Phytophthora pseudosyringae]